MTSTKPNQMTEDLPADIWESVIIPYFGLKQLALTRAVCLFFDNYWHDRFDNNKLPLCVPYDLKTIESALRAGEQLNDLKTYTKKEPCQIIVGEGIFGRNIGSSPLVLSYSLVLVGAGPEKTIFNGGFDIIGRRKHHVALKELRICNATGYGVNAYDGGASFALNNVVVKKCRWGIQISRTFGECTNVEVTECTESGIVVKNVATLTISGKKSCVHNNNTRNQMWVEGVTIFEDCRVNLVHPLTKELVFTNNGQWNFHRTRNWRPNQVHRIQEIRELPLVS